MFFAEGVFGNLDGHRRVLVQRPEHYADEQEEQHHRQDRHRAKDQCLTAIGNGAAGEHTLGHKLIDAMGEQHKDGRAEYAHPNIERTAQRKLCIQPRQFASFARGIDRRHPAAIDEGGDVK